MANYAFFTKTVKRGEKTDLAKKSKVNYFAWIYRKVRKRIPLMLFAAVLTAAISYAGIQFSLTTKAVINNAIAGNIDGLTVACATLIGLSLFRLCFFYSPCNFS